MPAFSGRPQTYLDERIEEVISGGKEPIVVRVFGQNLTVLREKGR
jgi:Cu/Ag efflux pump CusA